MTDRAEALAEAYRRNLMNPEQRAAYEEAMRRGLVDTGDDDPRSLGQRFLDNLGDAFNRNPIISGYRRGIEDANRINAGEDYMGVAAEGGIAGRLDPFRAVGRVVGGTLGLIDRDEARAAGEGYITREAERRERFAATSERDPFYRAPGGVVGQTLAGIATFGGQLVGSAADPINAVSPGRTVVGRAAGAGLVNAAGDVYAQGSDIGAGITDGYDPLQTLGSAIVGATISVSVDGVRQLPDFVRNAYRRPRTAPPEPEIGPVSGLDGAGEARTADGADMAPAEPLAEFRTVPLERRGFLADTGRALDDERGAPAAIAEAIGRGAHRLYAATFDRMHGLRGLTESMRAAIERETGRPIEVNPADDANMLARGSQDWFAIGQMDLLHGVHEYRGVTPTTPALADVMTEVAVAANRAGGKANDGVQQLGDYAAARRALDEYARFERGELDRAPVAEPKAQLEAYLKRMDAEQPHLKDAADRVSQFANAQLKKDLDAGFIDRDTYDAAIANRAGGFYVPLRRVMDDGERLGGSSVAGKTVKKLKGSDRDVVNPIEALVQRAYTQAVRVRQNEINRAVVTLAERLNRTLGEDNPFIRKLDTPTRALTLTESKRGQLARQSRDPEAEGKLEALFDDDPMLFFRGDENHAGKQVITVWRDGQRESWEIIDREWGQMAFEALSSMTRQQGDLFTEIVGASTTFVSRMVTRDPSFMLANFIRDQVSAWILTDSGFKPGQGVRGMLDDLTGADSGRLYGLGGGIAVGEAGNTIGGAMHLRDATELFRRRGRLRYAEDIKGGLRLIDDIWRSPELAEVGTRRELFKMTFERARREGLDEYNALIEASFKARDYIDFGRYGSRMYAMRRIFTFINPALQGLDKLVRTAVTDPASAVGRAYESGGRAEALRTILKPLFRQDLSSLNVRREDKAALKLAVHAWTRMAALGVMGASLSALFHDDEDYQQANERTRATHWIIPVAGHVVRIPKPFELAFMSNIAERAVEAAHGDSSALPRLGRGLVELFSPPTQSPLLGAITATVTDRDPETGRPIIPYGTEDLPPELQYEWWTSTMAQDIGGQIGMAPAKVDWLIRNFGGPFGSYLLAASDAADPDRADGQWVDLPVARRFISPSYRGSQDKADFYERVAANTSRLNRALEGVAEYERRGMPDAARRIFEDLDEAGRLYVMSQRGEAATDRLNPLHRARAFARQAGNMIGELNGADPTGEAAALPEMTASERAMVRDALEQLIVAEMGNAMIVTGQPGFGQRNLRDREALWRELETVSPEAAEELSRRLRVGRDQAYDYDVVMELWPDVERRLRSEGSGAVLTDLARRAASRSGRGRRVDEDEGEALELLLE